MFWATLIGLYVLTFSVNLVLRHLWDFLYSPSIYQVYGESISNEVILKAQIKAIAIFGTVQSALAAVPLIFGGAWYHYVVCLIAAPFYVGSGSPRHYLDRVRSSHLMLISAIVVFAVTAFTLKFVFQFEISP